MSDFWRLITLQDPNTRVVLLGVALLGLACGVIGSFAVLRRRALVGDAVAHAALPGVCLAYFVVGGGNLPAFLAGAFVSSLLAVGCITVIRRCTRIKEDAAIGVVLTCFFGLGVALSGIIQHQPGGNRAGLESFIFGKAAGMVRQDVLLIGVTGAAAIAVVAILYKELKLLCFDREFCGSMGRPVLLLDLLLMGLICVCTVIGLPAVGVVLMVALLVIPAAGARFWTESLGRMLVIAGAAGVFSGVTGASISALAPNVSTGPVVALAAAAFFAVSLLFAPGRGLVAAVVRRSRLRRRVLVENLLRAMYELDEGAAGAVAPALALKRSWTPAQLERAIDLGQGRGLVRRSGEAVELTALGAAEAAAVVRAHRLWELYLIEQADIAPDHVDRDADAIEHVLSPQIIAGLEEKLRASGRFPKVVPASPHPVSATGGAGALA